MRKQHGFTVIEIIIAITFLLGVGALFYVQRAQLAEHYRDAERKTAINAMYFSLEEVYFAKNQSYPSELTSTTLPSMDASLLKDPDGVMINEDGSSYRYEPSGCDGGSACKSYTLRATLERESDFTKNSRH